MCHTLMLDVIPLIQFNPHIENYTLASVCSMLENSVNLFKNLLQSATPSQTQSIPESW